jgi:hypothetical protein
MLNLQKKSLRRFYYIKEFLPLLGGVPEGRGGLEKY